MKRFTETEKWQDPWFRKLPGAHKLVFIFLIENCNNAGFYEYDVEHVAYLTGLEKKHIDGALKGLERGIVGASGWVWVRNFLRHQKNEELNEQNPAHKQIISLLRVQIERFKDCNGFADFVAPYMGLLSPIGNGTGKGKGLVGKESPERKPTSRPASARPTIDQALAYGEEIGMKADEVRSWFDHFEANGWRVGGKTPMRDWQAAMRNGNRMKGNFKPRNSKPAPKEAPAKGSYDAEI